MATGTGLSSDFCSQPGGDLLRPLSAIPLDEALAVGLEGLLQHSARIIAPCVRHSFSEPFGEAAKRQISQRLALPSMDEFMTHVVRLPPSGVLRSARRVHFLMRVAPNGFVDFRISASPPEGPGHHLRRGPKLDDLYPLTGWPGRGALVTFAGGRPRLC